MVRVEDYELEKTVLAGVSCFAVPVEAFVPMSGEPVITAYSVCIDKAREWERDYGDRLLSGESLDWLEREFCAFAEKLGYKRVNSENELMIEYVFTPDMQLAKTYPDIKVHKITSNAVLEKLCEMSGCDIEIADDGEDILFAVIEEGRLCAYAGMNDLCYEDGSIEISVETAPDYRRKGYGAACVCALTQYLCDKGITVRYKCSADNGPSLALCEKCGVVLEGKRFSLVMEKI